MERSLRELIVKFEQECLFEAYKKPLKKLAYSQVRFVLKKAQILCDEKKRRELENTLFKMLTASFPELKDIWKESFYVAGRKEIRKTMEMVVFDERQIISFGELGGKNASLAAEGNLVSDFPAAGSSIARFVQKGIELKQVLVIVDESSLAHTYDEKMSPDRDGGPKHVGVRIHVPFPLEEADEGQLWDLADRIFYEFIEGRERTNG